MKGDLTEQSRRLVLVTGAGRSGTSTISGTLSQLGLHLPKPLVRGNGSNPRGHFESRWVVDFHREILAKARTSDIDGNPTATDRVSKVLQRPAIRRRLKAWLTELPSPEQVVIKDPRTVWAVPLWESLASSVDASICYLTMLRHPAEVLGSRSAYYSTATDPVRARSAHIGRLAGWINVNLVNERQIRGRPRVFVRYDDLITDWRSTLLVVAKELSLEFNTDLSSEEPSPVDDFIEPGLRRIRATFDEFDMPAELVSIAEGVWDAGVSLTGGNESDKRVRSQFDELTKRYERLHQDAYAITSYARKSAVLTARREGAREARKIAKAKAKADSKRKSSPARRIVVRAARVRKKFLSSGSRSGGHGRGGV